MGTQTKTLAEQVADGIMNLIQETPYKGRRQASDGKGTL